MEIIIYGIVTLIIGVIIGFIIGRLSHRERPIGDLRVDHSDPTCEPYLFLELDRDVSEIMCRKVITLCVKVENFLPHK